MAAVLAMIFLVLMSMLVIGFYAQTNTSAIVSSNEHHAALALASAESGMDFMRYQLSTISIPPSTPQNQVFSYIADRLETALEATPNLTGNSVGVTASLITIPANPNSYIKLDNSGQQFRATIEPGNDGTIRVKVIGRSLNVSNNNRLVQLDYRRNTNPTTIFDYAIASRGRVSMQKGTVGSTPGVPGSIASIMSGRSVGPAISVSGGTIAGDISVLATNLSNVTGGSVGGTSSIPLIQSQHTHVVGVPEFPYVDTTVFRQYAVNTYVSGSVLKNVRIPANTNPKFTGGATIQGILYIESPNTVEFRGNVLMQGFIIFENKNNTAVNIIDMRGNTSHGPLPAGAEFDNLRWIKGISMLAPTAAMTISGSVDSFLTGNVFLGTFNNGGSADWTFTNGSLITLSEGASSAVFNGKTVNFASTGKLNMPNAGLLYTSVFRPDAATWQELKP